MADETEKPVTSIKTPMRLEYRYSAGEATSRFLRGIAQGKILGQRCPSCKKVYVPPRGSCPRAPSRPRKRCSSPTRARSRPSAS